MMLLINKVSRNKETTQKMTYLSALIWLILNYSYPKILKKEPLNYTD